MTDSHEKIILADLLAAERTGRLDRLEIEFWKGGGLPPPYYRSDQLRLMTVGGQEVVEFAALKWDKSYDPPNLQEKWTLPLQPARTAEVARLLLAANVLTVSYPEEQDPRTADIFSYEILMTAGHTQVKRKYYRRLPDQMAELQTALAGLIDLLKAQGRHDIYHQGKEVPQ